MDFIRQLQAKPLDFMSKNYEMVIIMVALIISLINIYISSTTNKYENNTQKQLNTFNSSLNQVSYGNILVFILLCIFFFDFVYNKRYTSVTLNLPSHGLDIINSIMMPLSSK